MSLPKTELMNNLTIKVKTSGELTGNEGFSSFPVLLHFLSEQNLLGEMIAMLHCMPTGTQAP